MSIPIDSGSSQDCPGHFGSIELAKPMYHCGFYATVVKVLRCVSYHNSVLLVSKVSAHLQAGSERILLQLLLAMKLTCM